jgi:hypothetical protein
MKAKRTTMKRAFPLFNVLMAAALVTASFPRLVHAASPAAEENARLLTQIEPQFKAIYESDEFAVRSFTATWL